MRQVLRTSALWAAPAAIAIGWLVVIAFCANLVQDQSGFRYGAVYLLGRYDQWLPLVGLGAAAATLAPIAQLAVPACVLVAGVLGFFLEGHLATAILTPVSRSLTYASLLSPLCCAAVGAGLAVPLGIRPWLIGPLGFIVGMTLGLLLGLDEPGHAGFLPAAVLTATLFLSTTLAIGRYFVGRPAMIASRIFGSWLIAIGVMILGSELVVNARLKPVLLPPPQVDQGPVDEGAQEVDSSKIDPHLSDPRRQP